jgi:pimeloyl-ACP methyl ester carboxylesterase
MASSGSLVRTIEGQAGRRVQSAARIDSLRGLADNGPEMATESGVDGTGEAPQDILTRIEQGATRIETPCGEGSMVWHVWDDDSRGDDTRPPLVLLHGGYGSWRHWIRTIPAFASDRCVIAPDLPGLGESAPPGENATQETIAAVLHEGLAAVLPQRRHEQGSYEQGRHKPASYDLVGFSFGGMIAGHLAAVDAARVRSLTVVGPGGLGASTPSVRLEAVIGLQGEARIAAHRTNLARLMLADPSRIDALALAIQDWNTRLGRIKSRPMSRTTSLQTVLARVQAPLNAIYGEFDAPAYPHLAEREKRLREVRPDVDFRVIRGAGHWVAYEAPDAFNAMLRGMLDR